MKIKQVTILLSVMMLCSCTMMGTDGYSDYQSYYNYEDLVPYAEGTSGPEAYQDTIVSPRPVNIPDSYHVGAYHSPTSFKDRDKTWVNSQNSQSYTIILAEGAKASYVAGRLMKAPKTDRSAQVQYQQGNQTYYKGVYGSYHSYEDAQKALHALPSDLQEGAQIKSFSAVQQ